jgi:hypothetical protein
MPQQSGILPLKGTMGNITFYKTAEGYMARQKGGLTAERIASDPAFQRTRENGAEFGKAGAAGKLLRTALRAFLQNASDSKTVSRLTREMVRVVKADTVNPRGLRNVIDGEAELLLGFEFNINGKLGTTLYAPFIPSVNRITGELKIDIPAFIPANMINAPAGTTHYRINSAGAEIDFTVKQYTVETQSSAMLPWDNVATAAISLTNTVTANSTHPLFLALGIEFFQSVNGSMYPLKNGSFNPLALVSVSGS